MGALVLSGLALIASVGCAPSSSHDAGNATQGAAQSAATAPPVVPAPTKKATSASAVAPASQVTANAHPTPDATPAPTAATAGIAPRTTSIPTIAATPAAPTVTMSPSGPQILSVVVSPRVIHAGQTVSWDVRTTSDVVTVAANVTAYHLPMQRAGTGHFVLNFTVPANVPGFFHGTYALDVRGETAAGASATRRVSLVFR